ncbi:MAG: tetratricopeptide repeat protein [Ignavibacteriaceae bacterium]|jgi:predicted negative regulator of RcsB-dependent stress response
MKQTNEFLQTDNNMKRYLYFVFYMFILLSFTSNNIFAQSNINKNILRGLDNIYNFRWTQAELTFQRLIDKYPDDPRGYYYKSSIYFWYYFSSKNKDDLQKFMDYSDEAIDKAVALLDSNSVDIETLYILGANYSYRAMAFTQQGKFLDAVWSTKKSESFLNKVIELNPKFHDAYLGLGLYNFALRQIPKALQWALSMAGMKGDKEKGLNYIKDAMTYGTYSKVEAKYYYSQILTDFFANYSAAAGYMRSLYYSYPDNLLFNYTLAVIYIKDRKLDRAERILNKIVKSKTNKFQQLVAYSNFLIGDILFKENKFESATLYYNKFILSTSSNDYQGIANYRLAICYEFMVQPDVANTYFKLSNRGGADIEDDIYAKRRGELFTDAEFSKKEMELVKFKHYVENARYKTAIDSLSTLCDSTNSDDIKAEALLNISDALFSLGKYSESADTALAAKSLEIKNEKWIKPFACFYIARAKEKLGNDDDVKTYISEAEDYKDYDYQNKLKNLLFGLKSRGKN